jgi:hypothetical protein
MFPVITAVLSFAAACVDFTSQKVQGRGPLAYLGESDSANCASLTAEHKVQKQLTLKFLTFTAIIFTSIECHR